MPEQSDLAQALQDVTRHAQLIVREEIELAKAEVTEKVTKLAKGAAVGAAAGVFVLAGLIYFLHAVAWFLWQQIGGTDDFWLGFLIVAVGLFLLAALAGFIAYRFVKGGAPPTPQMAIKEAQLVRETVSSSSSSTSVERTGA
jgi:Putative Actinobacterial Holin-X, holin superfamily III